MTRGNKAEKEPIDFLLTVEREREREGKEEGKEGFEDDARWRDGVIEKLSYFDNVYRIPVLLRHCKSLISKLLPVSFPPLPLTIVGSKGSQSLLYHLASV